MEPDHTRLDWTRLQPDQARPCKPESELETVDNRYSMCCLQAFFLLNVLAPQAIAFRCRQSYAGLHVLAFCPPILSGSRLPLCGALLVDIIAFLATHTVRCSFVYTCPCILSTHTERQPFAALPYVQMHGSFTPCRELHLHPELSVNHSRSDWGFQARSQTLMFV